MKDKIRCICFIRELFERVRTEPKAKEQICKVLSSRQLFSSILNPETSSRDYKHDEDGCLEDSTL
ncbi:MAG: hypothetical protein PUK36_01910 [Prevotella sp.]|nr:hypothetical protein [Prevotella sp.]